MVLGQLTKEQMKEELRKLIEDFKANRDKYKSLSEADIETKLVEELFISVLGWSKKDFEKQQNVRRGDKRGRADYAFKIGEKIVFFLEVKKVGVPLNNEADKQVVSYALSRKNVSFAISTNFEQMKIFCVEQDKAYNNVFRVFRDPDEYLTKIQDLFFLSKESFEKNELLKQAEAEGRLKKRITIDKVLLEDLMEIRKLIANDIEKKYPGRYNINEQDEIVQRIIDRLIFIRRAEDMGIQPNDLRLEDIKHLSGDKAYPKLKEIFKEYNSAYNSGLFDPNYDNDCDKIIIDGESIKKLVYLLYESKEGYIYNFDWIDSDVLGQVYEQYLGKILAQTRSGKAQLKEGQAHRKEQGIYYTPTYIVDYIVKNTVGELLKDKKVDPSKIKILDPACGSGSFLIKAYDYLANYIINKGNDSGQYKLDEQGHYSIKTEILKNNIYGVDLDQKAVEITKLNLLLKAAEKNRKLPKEVDLHIRHGNSLIDDEKVAGSAAFKWQGDFEEGTFDVVVGNPPYINNRNLADNEKLFFEKKYKTAHQQYDLYVLFYELALKLLRPGGYLAFITPNKFAITKYGMPLRKLFLENKILRVVDVSQMGVFSDASTYPYILVIQKSHSSTNKITIEKPDIADFNKREATEIKQSELDGSEPFLFNIDKNEQKILNKITGERAIGIYRAKPTAKEIGTGNEICITNKEIERYRILDSTKRIANNKNWLVDVPAILMKKICYVPTASILLDNNHLPINTVYVLHSTNKNISLEYLLGILNSKLIGYYARKKFGATAMQGGFIELRTFEIESIPIKIDNKLIGSTKTKVEKLIQLNKKLNEFGDKNTSETAKLKEEIERIDKEIDEEVYQLYGITEEEKKIIEDSLK
ncbi:N-6 DNA methylase [Candidatus Woesearchaeota archaeon]|nr:N-6 DNA methylase [Candidatus Woesearchaeota archaeon]